MFIPICMHASLMGVTVVSSACMRPHVSFFRVAQARVGRLYRFVGIARGHVPLIAWSTGPLQSAN